MTTMSPAELNRTTPTPIYLQLEGLLRRQVDSGEWPPHLKLPAEVELARAMQVSRTTLRRAIKALTAQGKLLRVHGRGTFVASPLLEQPLAGSLVAFSEELSQRGIAFETRLISQSLMAPPARVASLLSLAPGERVFALRRVRLICDEPIIHFENYVVVQHC